ncbi:MAG: hypothetical protein KDC38_06925 [Planctomycetes bacterium]|nr:hypothetical protein [Planctomycetota bacterium]
MGSITNLERAVLDRMLETKVISGAGVEELIRERDRRRESSPDTQVTDLLIERRILTVQRANRVLSEIEQKLRQAAIEPEASFARAIGTIDPARRRVLDWFVTHGIFDRWLAESIAVELQRRDEPELEVLDVLIERGLVTPAQANQLIPRMERDLAEERAPAVQKKSGETTVDLQGPPLPTEDRRLFGWLVASGAIDEKTAVRFDRLLRLRRVGSADVELWDLLIEQKLLKPDQANRLIAKFEAEGADFPVPELEEESATADEETTEVDPSEVAVVGATAEDEPSEEALADGSSSRARPRSPRSGRARTSASTSREARSAFHTKKSSPLPALIAILVLVGGAVAAYFLLQPDEIVRPSEELLRETLASITAASKARDGGRVVELMDTSTVEYFDRIRDLALHGETATVRALPTVDKVRVLLTRSLYPPLELDAMTGSDLLSKMISNGTIAVELIPDRFVLDAASARATFKVGDAEAPGLELGFVFQDGKWRVTHRAWTDAMDRIYLDAISKSPYAGDEGIEKMLESDLGRRLPMNVWEPLLPAEKS